MEFKKKSMLGRRIRNTEFNERCSAIESCLRNNYPCESVRLSKKQIAVTIGENVLTLKFYENETHPKHGRMSGCEIYDTDHLMFYKIIQFSNLGRLFDTELVVAVIIKWVKDWEKLVSGVK